MRRFTLCSSRTFQNVMHVFDRKTKMAQRNRSAFLQNPSTYDYVRDEVASRLADRVCDISRKFCVAVDLGCGRGHLSKYLTSDSVDLLYQCDSAMEILKQAPHSVDIVTSKLNLSEEFLPLRENSVDLVLSCLSLHWVNDIPGIFRQDIEELVVHYPNMFCLMDDLRGMGESNAAFNRPIQVHRDVLLAASAIYDEKFGVNRWKPDPSQQKPLPRGSAQFSLKDIGRIDELSKQLEEGVKHPTHFSEHDST
ncbi:hypothetical protein AHF37_07468 [Paragonimus kellicotti]|nr:hypothetical protein AHF37_07468 [Paragonimus kellicotti]